MGLKKLVLDVLKPIREPTLVTLAKNLSKVSGVREVSIVVSEMDVETLTPHPSGRGEGQARVFGRFSLG